MSQTARSRPHGGRTGLEIGAATKQLDPVRVPLGTDRAPVAALATAYLVVGTRGRSRLVLLVICPWCAHVHQHSAKADFSSGRRTAACHQGRYVVHVGSLEEGAA